MDPELPLCFVFQPSQKPAPKANIHQFGFWYRKIQEQYYLLSRKIIYPERLYSNSIIYHLTLFIILQCHYTIMHQFHNGYIWQACIWFVSCQAKDSETPKPMSAYCKTMAKNYVAGELCLWVGPGNKAYPPNWFKTALKAKFPIHSKIYSTML